MLTAITISVLIFLLAVLGNAFWYKSYKKKLDEKFSKRLWTIDEALAEQDMELTRREIGLETEVSRRVMLHRDKLLDTVKDERAALAKKEQDLLEEAKTLAEITIAERVKDIDSLVKSSVNLTVLSKKQDFSLAGSPDSLVDNFEKFLREQLRPIEKVDVRFRNSIPGYDVNAGAKWSSATLYGSIDLMCEQLGFVHANPSKTEFKWAEGTIYFKDPQPIPVSVEVNACSKCLSLHVEPKFESVIENVSA